jgi:hypothetical protein
LLAHPLVLINMADYHRIDTAAMSHKLKDEHATQLPPKATRRPLSVERV